MSIDMDSIIEAQEQYLTCEATEQVIILLGVVGGGGGGGGGHEKINFIRSLSYHTTFFLIHGQECH